MQESFLHFIWRTGRFHQQQLRTTSGQSVSVIRRGQYQGYAGPDFSGSHLRIGDTLWHGHVEMHIFASEWYKHKHQDDPAYEATVLHVVWEEDQPVFRRDGSRLPCLELKQRVDPNLLARYQRLVYDGNGIPCKFTLNEVPHLTKRSMLDRVLIERLERKARLVLETLKQQEGDWEETAWLHLAAGLGMPVNSEPMLQLTRSMPLRFLKRYAHAPLQIEALLFGQAGMLDAEFTEPYPKSLQKEFQFLQAKHQLRPMPVNRWKYLRMRPVAFPSLRIARLASLATHQENALANMLAASNPNEWINSLEVLVHPYWTKHYRFGLRSPALIKSLGKGAAEGLVINVLAPMLYAYGQARGESRWQEKAVDVLMATGVEKNAVTRKWKDFEMPLRTAADSQSLLELQKMYCTPRRCIHCAIGCHLITTLRKGNPILMEEPQVIVPQQSMYSSAGI